MIGTIELQDVILQKAGDLFREHGYAATSIKQIAQAAGCTNAALYYYFEGGKEHILREVIHQLASGDMVLLVEDSNATTLESMLIQLSQNLNKSIPRMSSEINWLLLQFPTLPDEEQQFIQSQLFHFHAALKAQLSRYTEDEATADHLAWLVFCSYFGYQQIFGNMQVGNVVDINIEEYGQFMAKVISTNNR